MRVLAFAAPLLLIAGQGQAVTTASVTAEARYEVRSVSGEPFVVQTIIDVFEPLLERTTGDGRASATFDIGPPPVVPPFVTSLETTLEANSGANGTAVAASFLEDDEFFVQNTTPGPIEIALAFSYDLRVAATTGPDGGRAVARTELSAGGFATVALAALASGISETASDATAAPLLERTVTLAPGEGISLGAFLTSRVEAPQVVPLPPAAAFLAVALALLAFRNGTIPP